MLSRRIISFGRCLTWKCQEFRALDRNTGDIWVPEPTAVGNLYPLSVHLDRAQDLERVWRSIVELYTTMSMTFGSDKLPALAGIAERFVDRQPGNTYLAGLWHDSLTEDLMWWPDGEATRSDVWRAPSWSWASLDGPVCYYTEKAQSLIAFVDYKPTPVSEASPYGELRAATLTLRARLGKIDRYLCKYRNRYDELFGRTELEDAQRALSSNEMPHSRDQLSSKLRFDTEDDELPLPSSASEHWTDSEDRFSILLSTSIWILPVMLTENYDVLLLARTEGGMYRRMGYFVVSDLDSFGDAEWTEDAVIRLV